jgi:hypothetical protein
MRVIVCLVAIAVAAAVAGSAQAATKKNQPVVLHSAAGTVIQPTRTIIHNPDGTTTIITVPLRSYLDPGTEVPVGYGNRMDYAFPPGSDPLLVFRARLRRRRRPATRTTVLDTGI